MKDESIRGVIQIQCSILLVTNYPLQENVKIKHCFTLVHIGSRKWKLIQQEMFLHQSCVVFLFVFYLFVFWYSYFVC